MQRLIILLLSIISFTNAYSQSITGVVSGVVRDKYTQEVIPGVTVQVEGTTIAVSTDADGKYRLAGLPLKSINLQASALGYKTIVKYNINITSGNDQMINFELEADQKELQEVNITYNRQRSAIATDMITPLSVQSLTTEEIRSNPGGNFDISKVVQVLPGVAGGASPSFRNDIVIRGGAPNENVFYLDGIEIPVLNHFQTQGSSGGPAGIINVSFIEEVKLATSAFDARYDNALASVFQFKQRQGNKERLSGNIRTSSTEVATTFEGPLGKNTDFIVSGRRSYLQLLFQALDFPIRPNYWDYQFKVSSQLSKKTTLTAIGIGAIDEFSFAQTKNPTPEKLYVLSSTPLINQWTYTGGLSLKQLINQGYINFSASRNVFNNELDRFENNDASVETNRILKIRSVETENKFRLDVNKFTNGIRYSYGASAQYVAFSNDIFNRIRNEVKDAAGNITQPKVVINSSGQTAFWKYGFFGQASKYYFDRKLVISAGLRSDMNSFTDNGNDPLQTLSPRISISYKLLPKINWNSSYGSYFKIPPYTVIAFQNDQGNYVNKSAKYIKSIHYVSGFEYLPKDELRLTVEGFYKNYSNYPVSVRDGISLANQGGNFGFVGNEAVTSTGNGKAYGFEIYAQQKLEKNFFAVISYTFVRSKFSGTDGKFISTAWDYRNLISALLGRKFNRGWEIGLKYRYSGGAPNTPFDDLSSRVNYLSLGTGILDYNRLNTDRLRSFSQLDLRVDKKINLKRATIDIYLDITNVLASKTPDFPQYSFKRTEDNSGFQTTDGLAIQPDGSNAIPVLLQDENAILTPSLGFIFEF